MPLDVHRNDIPHLIHRLQSGQRSALARLLTLASMPNQHAALIANLPSHPSRSCPVIAMTGSGGVGKSSLLGCLTSYFADRGELIGVLACDPESPITGGALLGDRCRIARPETSERVFVRSLSTISGQQGVAANMALVLQVMKAYGFDRIFVETVGIGQGDVAARDVADIVVLTLQPHTGDELQWEKAGVLEIADIVVVNKSDLPAADRTVSDVTQQLHIDHGQIVPVIKTSVAAAEGIETLCKAIDQRLARSSTDNPRASKSGSHLPGATSQTTLANCDPLECNSLPLAVGDDDSAKQIKISDASINGSRKKMSSSDLTDANTDPLLLQIADYVCGPANFSSEAWGTSRLCLLDSLGCGLLALNYPQCTKLLGPVVPGATLHDGARVPGTSYELDPVTAAFNIGCMIRWLDYNDTWLAAEWGHPSDNLGGILAVADYLSRQGRALTIRDVLAAAIKAYEIQGVLALVNAFNRVGLDHVLLVRIATTAVVTQLLGGSRQQVINAVSNAWLDGGALRTYRHAPNTGSRKSWAAGDATRRGVQLALWSMSGEMGYATALSAPQWGFEDVVLAGRKLLMPRPLECYVMENILFKVAFPAEFHAQTAAEAAINLHPQIAGRWDEIDRIRIETQESAMRIINKTGPLMNPADRDHCLQYIVAVALLSGRLDSDHYENSAAADPRLDRLRERMEVIEQAGYTSDYLDSDKRSIANAVQVFFADGSSTDRVEIEYPLGHRRRRDEALPLLKDKFRVNAGSRFDSQRVEILERFFDKQNLDGMRVDRFVDEFVVN